MEQTISSDYSHRLEEIFNSSKAGIQAEEVNWFKRFFLTKANKITPTSQENPYTLFYEVDDDFWFWLNTEGYRQNEKLREILPALPAEEIQTWVCGMSGDAALEQSFNFYKKVKQYYQANV